MSSNKFQAYCNLPTIAEMYLKLGGHVYNIAWKILSYIRPNDKNT
jgi:hypothetical protein